MASKNFSGILRDPLGTLASNDKYRFTHVSTTGEVIRGSTSYLTIGDDGVYNIDIEYGNVSIESYSELGKRWIAQGTTTINADTTVTTLPALLNALVPASDALILQLEALLADAESAADRAEAAADNLGTAAAADVTTSPTDTTAGRLLKVGDFGISGLTSPPYSSTLNYDSSDVYTGDHRIINASNITLPTGVATFGTLSVSRYANNDLHQTYKSILQDRLLFRRIQGELINDWVEMLHTGNTTVDSNGFIKEASPIVKVFANSAEFNSECPEDANYKKPSTGVYLIKNTLGLAKNGWYIESPKDANGNVKIYVEYSEFENGDIEVRTFKPDYSQGFCGGSEPMDIPEGRWIDLRLEKPDKSVLDFEVGDGEIKIVEGD